MKCSLCDSNAPKYKCPTCRIPYCSLKCWRTHRDGECEESVTETSPNLISGLDNYSFPTRETVPLEKLQLLGQSQEVRNTLYNPHVRNILNIIDKSENPRTVMIDAMQEPIFVQFVEECLKVVEPTEKNSSDSD